MVVSPNHPAPCAMKNKNAPRQFAAIFCLSALCGPAAYAQMLLPGGYTGHIVVPSADVLPTGQASLSYTNTIPERAPRAGMEGQTVDAGFGVLPGLELAGRLSWEGSAFCNLYDPACKPRAGMRDLSASGKYQLPWELPLHSRVALGFSDMGGAASNFRSVYGVGTTSLGPLDMSLGYAHATGASPALDGVFYGATLHLFERFALQADSDGASRRAGLSYVQPLGNQTRLRLGVAHRFGGDDFRGRSTQLTAALEFALDGDSAAKAERQAKKAGPTPAERKRRNDGARPEEWAARIAEALNADGFVGIRVWYARAQAPRTARWWVQAEPVLQRQDLAGAVGRVVATWWRETGTEDAQLTVMLAQFGQPVADAQTDSACLQDFWDGSAEGACQRAPLRALAPHGQAPGTSLLAEAQLLASAGGPARWRPQLELGVGLVTSVGTEAGLVDAATALIAGLQLPLAQGLFWQGDVQVPMARTNDYRSGGPFRRMGYPKTRLNQALLTYLHPLAWAAPGQAWSQWSVGAINAYARGGQWDGRWSSASGNWRVDATAAIYSRSRVVGSGRETNYPLLLGVRYAVPGLPWTLEATGGEFLAGDRGALLRSRHWFGNTSLSFFVHESSASTAMMPRHRFAGIEISVPLGGGKRGVQGDWGSARLMDRFAWSQRTKVGEGDNVITSGYAEVPQPRHGIAASVTDYDRITGPGALQQRAASVREGLYEAWTQR